MAPEIFSAVGGIPRILQIYLRALSEMTQAEGGRLRMIALNDPALDTGDLRRCTSQPLDDWYVCNRRKGRFVREAFRISRGCDRILCGHVAQLPVAWMIRRLRPAVSYYAVAHGIDVWRPFSLLEKWALRGATRIFCVSEYTRQELLRYCPLAPGRAVVLPNALDPNFEIRPGRPLAECPPVILTVTRLNRDDRYKGVEHLIQAMPAVQAALPQARLRIIGQGDDRRRLFELARKQGPAADTIEFLGYLGDKKLAAEMEKCRLFALPSRKEGFGIVYLEAMANGRPCLGARAGGTPEVITEATGTLVEFGDPGVLARACIEALQRPWDQAAILERVRHFSYERFKERLAAQFAS